MTEETQEKEIVFDDEQQKLVNKRIGEARVKARELAKTEFEKAAKDATDDAERKELAASAEFEKLAKMHADRVAELEPRLIAAEAKAADYDEYIMVSLKAKIKALGDAAKTAVKALPEGLSDKDKLDWLNKNQELFATDARRVPGTPAAKLRKQAGKKERPEGHRQMRLS